MLTTTEYYGPQACWMYPPEKVSTPSQSVDTGNPPCSSTRVHFLVIVNFNVDQIWQSYHNSTLKPADLESVAGAALILLPEQGTKIVSSRSSAL
ncbi:hypothetical protein PAAG_11239 [Paracoccidioides lutzii Pb01]|uniref:Uncharacterized protein n=1 Tax=Paracoccidioides lutzii (strain ATCC MYA-826 / Pb01) TaxID=502779 RepID=A0A0A2V3J6_PARBA|nr:hypothetical protein PAAG_11239 [Paracoccidioides lutzii Pb01]KGQ02058.1 hypothetical protein PAAG_11239 [Paracoccidioides lutzii Pb01]